MAKFEAYAVYEQKSVLRQLGAMTAHP